MALDTADLAVERVARRAQQGDHNIPEDTIRHRFVARLYNFKKYYRPQTQSRESSVRLILYWIMLDFLIYVR